MRLSREDMLAELTTDQINQLVDLIIRDDYATVHAWLQPLLTAALEARFSWRDDPDGTELAHYYEQQLGVPSGYFGEE